jgi:transposase
VTAVGVDETAFLRANATRSTTFATGIADLTPGRPARLLDVVEGRSGTVLASWLAEQDSAWRAGISTASLDPFRWVSGWRWLMGRHPGGACAVR